MKRILFITSGSIGDAIISTGILGWLADSYPDALFTIAAGGASAPLFAYFPRLERLLPITKRPYHGHWLKLWNDTRGVRWDLVVDLRGSLLSYLIGTDRRKILLLLINRFPKPSSLPPCSIFLPYRPRAFGRAMRRARKP